MEKLEERQPKDFDDFWIETVDRATRVGGNQVIERRLPPDSARCNFSGQRTIAFVFQFGARSCKRGWKIGAAAADVAQHVIGREPRRRDHAGVSRVPARIAWPARNSR